METCAKRDSQCRKSSRPKLYIEHLHDDYLQRVREGLSFIGFGEMITKGDHVFIKPNLTLPRFEKGVMTNPECLEQVIVAVKDYTDRITIGESDGGGYYPFPMDEVFEKTGLRALAKKHGVQIVNMTKLPSKPIEFQYKGKNFAVPIARLLLEETALSITVPVPKMHMHTKVTVSIKNQWGCIQEPSLRLKLHPYFEKVIYEVNKAVKMRVSIVDGKYGLNRCGPLKGDVVDLDWILVADDILAADMVCCRLMRIDPASVEYLRFYREQQGSAAEKDIVFNNDYREFVGPQFYMKRPLLELPGHLMFRSPFLAWLGYRSPLAEVLHKIKYLFTDRYY